MALAARRSSTQTMMTCGLARARGAQDVEPRAVAVPDLEAEALGLADPVGARLDHRDLRAAREQDLQRDLPEAAEADHQHLPAQAVGRLDPVERGRALAQQPVGGEQDQGRDRHRQDHHGGEDRVLARVDHARRRAPRCRARRRTRRPGRTSPCGAARARLALPKARAVR
jgi:hypothetical protein